MEKQKKQTKTKAEESIDALALIRPDIKHKDIEFIFHVGAMYASAMAKERMDKVRELVSAFGAKRADRVADVGRRP